MTSSVQEQQEAPPLLSKTCQNCYHLKIRCDRTQPGPTCDRCRRLGKNCVYRPARRRYKSAKRDGRIEALESKIDELMRSRASSPTDTNPSNPEVRRERSLSGSSPGSCGGAVQLSRSSGDVIEDGLLTMERANHLVGIYKSTLTTHFPFVIIPPQLSAESLRQEKPFLFLTVLASASFHDMPLQRNLGNVVKQIISERMVRGDTGSFELLQGILVFLAWSHYHQKPRRYSQYLQLAISIVSDLRLDRKPIASWETHVGACRDPSALRSAPPDWGADEKRALAGCFYLSSTQVNPGPPIEVGQDLTFRRVSKLLQKLNAFPYTRYLEECCISLCEQYEHPTDEHVYYIIRLQRIMEAIEYMSQQHTDGPTARAAVIDLRSQLETFRNHLPFDLGDNQLLLMQYRTAEMYLCQTAFFYKAVQLDTVLHAELLCSGLAAAKSLMDFYLSLPVYADMAFNNSEWIQISFAITVASRLAIASTHRAVDHQTRALRQSLDLSNIIRHLSLRIGALVTQQVDAQGGRDIFYHYDQRVRRMQAWYERCSAPSRKVKVEQQPQQQQHIAAAAAPHTMAPFTHDALGLLSQPPSGATTPVNGIYPAAEPTHFFQNLPTDPCVWSSGDSSQSNTPDVKMTELFPELDYIFCDWLSPVEA
ncbi:hypothetical protein DL770_004463 [Monosporascus sp. CRB-9-2]|nr:hypothetical protein DL770_004463 [Monosporascus sp. CRB-9-2]